MTGSEAEHGVTIEKNNELFPAVVAGDAAAREAMIVNNLGLVVVKADSLIRQMPSVAYLRDDLVSAGYIGLVRAVNKVPTGRVRHESREHLDRTVRDTRNADTASARAKHSCSTGIQPPGPQHNDGRLKPPQSST